MSLRKVLGVMVFCAAIVVLQTQGWAQKRARKPQKEQNPAFAAVQDNPSLPRVLLIGDSISIGYTVAVREALAGKANVHRIPVNGGSTLVGMQNIDAWLGGGHWDVIHFNWGLHDLKNLPNGNNVPLAQYKQNLSSLVERLKKTKAKLIWCTTTPVQADNHGPVRSNEDVIAYNAAAKKIVEENGVAINDLYAFALPKLKELQQPANVHFTNQGSSELGKQVAAAILKALPAK